MHERPDHEHRQFRRPESFEKAVAEFDQGRSSKRYSQRLHLQLRLHLIQIADALDDDATDKECRNNGR